MANCSAKAAYVPSEKTTAPEEATTPEVVRKCRPQYAEIHPSYSRRDAGEKEPTEKEMTSWIGKKRKEIDCEERMINPVERG